MSTVSELDVDRQNWERNGEMSERLCVYMLHKRYPDKIFLTYRIKHYGSDGNVMRELHGIETCESVTARPVDPPLNLFDTWSNAYGAYCAKHLKCVCGCSPPVISRTDGTGGTMRGMGE